MVIFNNHHWWKYTAEAEKNKIVHADIILDHLEEIEDSWCNGLADWDGTIIRRQYSDKAIARQKNALKAYLAEFGNELSYGEVELVRDAQLSIKP